VLAGGLIGREHRTPQHHHRRSVFASHSISLCRDLAPPPIWRNQTTGVF
jgi:hypothetical protein